MNCGAYRGVKLLEHAMKIVEKMLERRLWHKVKVDEMQFGFMPGQGTIDAVFILHEEVTRGVLLKTRTRSCICASMTWRRHLTASRGRYWNGQ